MNQHTAAIITWLSEHSQAGVRSYVNAVPLMPIGEKAQLLRNATIAAGDDLAGVNFELVDWTRAVEVAI